LLLGAALSLGLMFWTGHRNSSLILILLFTFWVASPFAGMALVLRRSRRWPVIRQSVTCNQIRIISLGSAFIYAGVSMMNFAKPAGPFLVVPIASWLLLAVWFSMTRHVHGEGSDVAAVLNLTEKR
jgi:hypothetical protein